MSWLKDSLRDFIHKGDLFLLALCTGASLYGLALIYSATRYIGGWRNVIIQSAAIGMGIVIYFFLSSVDFEIFTERTWKFLFLFNIGFNLLVRTPLGIEVGGNRSWVHIPGFPVNLQPAEITKFSFVLLLAWQYNKLRERGVSRPTSILQTAGHTLLLCGLIAWAAGDFGMVFTYLFIFVVISWSAGVKKRWFILAITLVVVAIVVIWPHVSDDYRMARFTVVIDHLTGNPDTIWEQTQGVGYQQTRCLLAIGSGGLFGMGYLKGVQTQSTSPVSLMSREADNIFAVCGEELGLVGCAVILLFLAAIILRCVWVARRAASPQSALIAMGFAGMLLVQTAVNVGMCLYVFPVIGLTLPFFSYGGSSIVTMFAAMGVVSSIKMRSLPSWLKDRSGI